MNAFLLFLRNLVRRPSSDCELAHYTDRDLSDLGLTRFELDHLER